MPIDNKGFHDGSIGQKWAIQAINAGFLHASRGRMESETVCLRNTASGQPNLADLIMANRQRLGRRRLNNYNVHLTSDRLHWMMRWREDHPNNPGRRVYRAIKFASAADYPTQAAAWERATSIFGDAIKARIAKTSNPPLRVARRTADGMTVRANRLRREYDMTEADYDAMYAAQKGCCAICHIHVKRPYVDHNHKTGKVRALLCSKCNTMIGMASDSIAIMESAIAYLTKHEKGLHADR